MAGFTFPRWCPSSRCRASDAWGTESPLPPQGAHRCRLVISGLVRPCFFFRKLHHGAVKLIDSSGGFPLLRVCAPATKAPPSSHRRHLLVTGSLRSPSGPSTTSSSTARALASSPTSKLMVVTAPPA
jgi:hypothetical protein